MPGLSPQLQEQITSEAKKAWKQTEAELPWLIPFRRLVASAAAAIVIIWMADYYSESRLAQWQNVKFTISREQPSDLDALTEIPYSPLARHLVSAGRRVSITDASALRSYTETVRSILNESQQNGSSKPSTPAEGRSILLPKQSGFNSYS